MHGNVTGNLGRLTSVQVSVRFIRSKEHGLVGIQDHVVEEVDGEAADVAGVLRMEAEQQLAVTARCVLACRAYKNPSTHSIIMLTQNLVK